MKLFLSSEGFGNHVAKLHELAGDDKRVLFIDNAKDYYTAEQRAQHVAEKIAEFKTAGFEVTELDLRNYFDTKITADEIDTKIIWLSGGNTFILRKALAYSGFDTVLTKLVKNVEVIYGGSSAGSIVATKTLRGTEYGDEPNIAPAGYQNEIVWNGLGLVDVQIVPHVDSQWFGDSAKAMIDYFEQQQIEHIDLHDGDVYVVDGDYSEVLR